MSGSSERDTTPGCAAAQGRRDAASAPSHPVAAASPGNDTRTRTDRSSDRFSHVRALQEVPV